MICRYAQCLLNIVTFLWIYLVIFVFFHNFQSEKVGGPVKITCRNFWFHFHEFLTELDWSSSLLKTAEKHQFNEIYLLLSKFESVELWRISVYTDTHCFPVINICNWKSQWYIYYRKTVYIYTPIRRISFTDSSL